MLRKIAHCCPRALAKQPSARTKITTKQSGWRKPRLKPLMGLSTPRHLLRCKTKGNSLNGFNGTTEETSQAVVRPHDCHHNIPRSQRPASDTPAGNQLRAIPGTKKALSPKESEHQALQFRHATFGSPSFRRSIACCSALGAIPVACAPVPLRAFSTSTVNLMASAAAFVRK